MELISKVSKGSKMDQIYIPKNRSGLSVGSYVIITCVEKKLISEKPFFYNIDYIEPVKIEIINKIFSIINKKISNYENIIIVGSFVDKGFNFNDIDIMLITNESLKEKIIENEIRKETGIKSHLLVIDNKSLLEGLSTDPMYKMLLSKSVSKKRLIFKLNNQFNYKLLDLHLLKSKTLIDNFDVLNGNEKYKLTRNMIVIFRFLNNKKITRDLVDSEIKKVFGLKSINELKQNVLDKGTFLRIYKMVYRKMFNKIMMGVKNGSEQKQIN